jgi:hypothetical protein
MARILALGGLSTQVRSTTPRDLNIALSFSAAHALGIIAVQWMAGVKKAQMALGTVVPSTSNIFVRARVAYPRHSSSKSCLFSNDRSCSFQYSHLDLFHTLLLYRFWLKS